MRYKDNGQNFTKNIDIYDTISVGDDLWRIIST
jgi:hypothetical protein